MDWLAVFMSTRGRLAARPFWLAVIALYVAGLVSQVLLSTQMMSRSGFWPFIIVQAALIWAWVALHIKRLHDAGHTGGPAVGVATIYTLALALMLLFVAFFAALGAEAAAETARGEQGPVNNLLGLMLALVILNMLYSSDFGVVALILKALVLMACAPLFISLAFSIWTGTRPSIPAQNTPAPSVPAPGVPAS